MTRTVVLSLALVLVQGCGWAPFGDDDDHDAHDAGADGDGDGDGDAPVACRGQVCVSGGIQTLGGPALGTGSRVVHSTSLERVDRLCGRDVCVEGGIEP